jgi:hypothetical protein
VQPHRRGKRAHLGLVGGAGDDANRRRWCEDGRSGLGVIWATAGGGWGVRVIPVPCRCRRASVELEQGPLGMGKTAHECGVMREREGREWQWVSSRNGRHCHLSPRVLWRCRAPSPHGRGAGLLWGCSVGEWGGAERSE